MEEVGVSGNKLREDQLQRDVPSCSLAKGKVRGMLAQAGSDGELVCGQSRQRRRRHLPQHVWQQLHKTHRLSVSSETADQRSPRIGMKSLLHPCVKTESRRAEHAPNLHHHPRCPSLQERGKLHRVSLLHVHVRLSADRHHNALHP
jgi:hypothetical protein